MCFTNGYKSTHLSFKISFSQTKNLSETVNLFDLFVRNKATFHTHCLTHAAVSRCLACVAPGFSALLITASNNKTFFAACWTICGSLCASAIFLPAHISVIRVYQQLRSAFRLATNGVAPSTKHRGRRKGGNKQLSFW